MDFGPSNDCSRRHWHIMISESKGLALGIDVKRRTTSIKPAATFEIWSDWRVELSFKRSSLPPADFQPSANRKRLKPGDVWKIPALTATMNLTRKLVVRIQDSMSHRMHPGPQAMSLSRRQFVLIKTTLDAQSSCVPRFVLYLAGACYMIYNSIAHRYRPQVQRRHEWGFSCCYSSRRTLIQLWHP